MLAPLYEYGVLWSHRLPTDENVDGPFPVSREARMYARQMLRQPAEKFPHERGNPYVGYALMRRELGGDLWMDFQGRPVVLAFRARWDETGAEITAVGQ